MTLKDISDAVQTLFNFTIVDDTAENIVYRVISDKTAILDKVRVNAIISDLTSFDTDENVVLSDAHTYEVFVRNESRIRFPREINQKDNVNKVEYRIDKPSDKYLVFFLFSLAKQNTPQILRTGIMPHRLRNMYGSSTAENTSVPFNVLDVIKEVVPRFETLKITSEVSKRKNDFEQLVYAFLFQLAYNLDFNYQPLRFLDEFIQPYRLRGIRRSNISDLEPPKRTYINELVLHYQKGISSESIEHQFLSFYHVLEHFYERIYNDDILNSVKAEITKPDFSYKRNKDVSALIGIIQSRLKYKNEEFQLNEPEALELTLKKFIKDISTLSNELRTISPQLIDYYRTNEVPFSKGNRVNFDSPNVNEIFTNLAKRIYLTRNSIVHSKETDKSKYTPFRDDKDLLSEIYLLRLVSEIVILENSQEL